jgi:hypothetical protein
MISDEMDGVRGEEEEEEEEEERRRRRMEFF